MGADIIQNVCILIILCVFEFMYLVNKNLFKLFSAHLFVDFFLIFIFNVSRMILQCWIFVWTIYLCLKYLGPCLRYICNCLGNKYFYYSRFVHIWWPVQRFTFESSLWEILFSIILYFMDLFADLHRISCSHILTANWFVTICTGVHVCVSVYIYIFRKIYKT